MLKEDDENNLSQGSKETINLLLSDIVDENFKLMKNHLMLLVAFNIV